MAFIMSTSVCTATILHSTTQSEWTQIVILFFVCAFWVLPFRFYKAERFTAIDTFISSFGNDISLANVVLCDLLTSYSKILLSIILESAWTVIYLIDWTIDFAYSFIQHSK